jgi:predicted GNAT family acetyltransferase
MTIDQTDNSKKGNFKAIEDGVEAGSLFYTWAGSNKIIIDHTEVDPKFSGKGVGKKLLMEAVKFAREKKIKILPLCPFAKSVFDKSPEIEDVLF